VWESTARCYHSAIVLERWLGRHTCLFDLHVALGARLVDFGGWDMPVAYGSQIEEHHAVRARGRACLMSRTCASSISRRAQPREFLRGLLANDVERLQVRGKALYSCMLNEAGGVLDDLIVYFLDSDFFRLVVNAGTRDKDLAWIRGHAQAFALDIVERTDLAMLAIQGPEARARAAALMSPSQAAAAMDLAVFFGAQLGDWFVARTGYTGEDGFEIMLPSGEAAGLWQALNSRRGALLRPGCARYLAPGGGHEPVRQRHG
jgi:aminomethyltransferase